MRIENVRVEDSSEAKKLVAEIVWEQAEKKNFEMSFVIPAKATVKLQVCAEPFVLAAFTRAFDAGERRLQCDMPVAAGLLDGMRSAISVLKFWHAEKFGCLPVPQLDIESRREARFDNYKRKSTAFYSGGVDATHLLMANSDQYDSNSVGCISHVLMVHGLDIGKSEKNKQQSVFDAFVRNSEPFLQSRKVDAIPLTTNLRHLDPRLRYFLELGIGFDLAACAAVFAHEFSHVAIATAGERLSLAVQNPASAHPIIHHLLASMEQSIITPHVEVSRLERVRRICSDDTAMSSLRVCFHSSDEALNCGHCEKCLRTMVAIEVAGGDCEQAFPCKPMPSAIRKISLSSEAGAAMWKELLQKVAESDRQAFVPEIKGLLRRWYWSRSVGQVRATLADFDSRYLFGVLHKGKSAIDTVRG